MKKEVFVYTQANNENNDISVQVFPEYESAYAEMLRSYNEAVADAGECLNPDEDCLGPTGWHIYDGDIYRYGTICQTEIDLELSEQEKEAIFKELKDAEKDSETSEERINLPKSVVIKDEDKSLDSTFYNIADILSDRYGYHVHNYSCRINDDYDCEVYDIGWDLSQECEK